jgi:two-component system, response regulator PdtaR
MERAALRREVADLTERLEARKAIDRAKAILMVDGLSEKNAFAHIQREAMNGRTSMRAIAEKLVADRT